MKENSVMNQGSRSENSLRNTAVGIINKLITLIVSFISRTIFIQLLGAQYLGVNALYSNILTVLSLADLGMGNVMIYSMYKPILEKDETQICSLLYYFKKIYIKIAVCISIIGISIIPFLGIIVNSSLPHSRIIIYYLLFLLNSVASYFAIYKSALINADQKVYINNLYFTVFLLIQNIVQIVFLLITKNYMIFLCIQIICTLLNNISISFRADQLYPFIKKKVTKIKFDIRLVGNNIKSMFLCKVGTVIMNNTDNILISMILGTIYVGFYSNYCLIITNISTFINIIVQAMYSSLGNLNASNEIEKSYKIFNGLLLFFHWLSAFCTLCFLLVLNDFITIWIGKSYILGFNIVFAIAANFYLQNIVNPVWMFRETMGLFKEIKYTMIIASAINLILSIILGYYLGLFGILIATVIARILTTLWYEPFILYKKKFHKRVKAYYCKQIKYMLTTGAAVLIASLLCRNLPVSLPYIFLKISTSFLSVSLSFVIINYRKEEFIMLFDYALRFIRKKRTAKGRESIESMD